MPGNEHPFETLSKALEEVNMARNGEQIDLKPRATSSAKPVGQAKAGEPRGPHPLTALSQAAERRRMKLPPILVDEAAKLIFEYWERYAAEHQGVQPIAWASLKPAYQALWRDITSTALEMGISVVLKDAVHTMDVSNGDMGGAYAKALKRYMRERLDI